MLEWEDCSALQRLTAAQPDLRGVSAGAFRQYACHPRQHVVTGVRLGDAFGELREDLVGRCSLPVHEPVSHLLHPLAYRLEADGNDGGGHNRQPQIWFAATADESANADCD